MPGVAHPTGGDPGASNSRRHSARSSRGGWDNLSGPGTPDPSPLDSARRPGLRAVRPARRPRGRHADATPSGTELRLDQLRYRTGTQRAAGRAALRCQHRYPAAMRPGPPLELRSHRELPGAQVNIGQAQSERLALARPNAPVEDPSHTEGMADPALSRCDTQVSSDCSRRRSVACCPSTSGS